MQSETSDIRKEANITPISYLFPFQSSFLFWFFLINFLASITSVLSSDLVKVNKDSVVEKNSRRDYHSSDGGLLGLVGVAYFHLYSDNSNLLKQ